MKSYKIFFLILASAAILWACETTDPFVNDVQKNLFTGNYDDALVVVNTKLAEDSLSYLAHYYKGVVLATKAFEMEPPSSRKSLYKQARSSFDTAKMLMDEQPEKPDTYEDLTNSILSFWADEYNTAVNIQNEDSLFNSMDNPYQVSLDHLLNAATINPDSSRTFEVISSTYFQLNDDDDAISSYETAMDLKDHPTMDDYQYLISLYLHDNQYEKAIKLSNEGLEMYPGETTLIEFLSDAYIQAGEREKAISLVQDLIDKNPDNAQYRRVLGTQIYQSVESISNEVSDLYEEQFELRQAARNQRGQELEQTQAEIEDLQSQIDSKEQEVDRLSEISIREMKQVVQLEPDSESAHYILGIIYQNRAANYFERRNNTMDNDLASEYDSQAKDNLREAMKYYEQAAKINPDNTENWQSLFQVYTALGMEEKAEEAMQKAGMDDSN